MANVVVTTTDLDLNVSQTVSNISVTDSSSNVVVTNVATAVANVTVSSTETNVNVSQSAIVSNAAVRTKISVENVSAGVIISEPFGKSNNRIASIKADEPEFTITPCFFPIKAATRPSNSETLCLGLSP